MCPTQNLFLPYLFLTTPEGSTLILLSLFLFLCSYFLLLPLFPHGSTLLLTNSSPSLTETIYLSLRRNQTLTKVSASIVGKYICLFSIMDILMVVWFALVSLLCSLVWLLEAEILCFVKLGNHEFVSLYIYIYIYAVLRSFETVLVSFWR